MAFNLVSQGAPIDDLAAEVKTHAAQRDLNYLKGKASKAAETISSRKSSRGSADRAAQLRTDERARTG
jgi:hypothetical protein